MAHTPGPWKSIACTVRTLDGRQVALCNGYVNGADDNESPFANARLIAAAPELLEQLEIAVAILEQDWEGDEQSEACNAMRAAIAKTKGGA